MELKNIVIKIKVLKLHITLELQQQNNEFPARCKSEDKKIRKYIEMDIYQYK